MLPTMDMLTNFKTTEKIASGDHCMTGPEVLTGTGTKARTKFGLGLGPGTSPGPGLVPWQITEQGPKYEQKL